MSETYHVVFDFPYIHPVNFFMYFYTCFYEMIISWLHEHFGLE